MEKNLRLETELRALMTAIITENIDIREKILDFPFVTKEATRIQAKLIEVFLNDPNADYSVLVSSLSREDQVTMIEKIDNALSRDIEDDRVSGVLSTLKQDAATEKLKRQLSDLLISDEVTAEDLQGLAENASEPSEETDSLTQYLQTYDIPIDVISTGFPKLDKICGGGLACGTISALGARPSVGKTTMGINIITHDPSVKTIFFSLEMSLRMVYDKIVADKADLNYAACVQHTVNIETVKAVVKKYVNLQIYDNVYFVEDIASIIRREKPSLVLIDYIQIVQTKQDIDVLRQRINHISSVIKRTAKQTGAHIMCLSQINRDAKEDPTMSALKESGGLEEMSDYIFLLKRPYVLNKSDDKHKPEETELIIDKNKFGEAGVLDFSFVGARQRFKELGFKNEKPNDNQPVAKMRKDAISDDDLPF